MVSKLFLSINLGTIGTIPTNKIITKETNPNHKDLKIIANKIKIAAIAEKINGVINKLLISRYVIHLTSCWNEKTKIELRINWANIIRNKKEKIIIILEKKVSYLETGFDNIITSIPFNLFSKNNLLTKNNSQIKPIIKDGIININE